jgi:glutamine amidotransferase
MSDPEIAIIDYGMGNLFNVQCACASVGLQSVVTADKKVIQASRGMILPGVGAFGDAMNNLKKLDLVSVIKDHVAEGKPFFGICLGIQLLLTESEEFGAHKGLDIIKGRVVRFRNRDENNRLIKVPQVGWNQVHRSSKEDAMLQGVADGEYMYFVHSYYAVPEDKGVALTMTDYEGTKYCSSLLKGSIFATQFHPEKSGVEGLKIYQNWAELFQAEEKVGK